MYKGLLWGINSFSSDFLISWLISHISTRSLGWFTVTYSCSIRWSVFSFHSTSYLLWIFTKIFENHLNFSFEECTELSCFAYLHWKFFRIFPSSVGLVFWLNPFAFLPFEATLSSINRTAKLVHAAYLSTVPLEVVA